jgi:hypothetical protein
VKTRYSRFSGLLRLCVHLVRWDRSLSSMLAQTGPTCIVRNLIFGLHMSLVWLSNINLGSVATKALHCGLEKKTYARISEQATKPGFDSGFKSSLGCARAYLYCETCSNPQCCGDLRRSCPWKLDIWLERSEPFSHGPPWPIPDLQLSRLQPHVSSRIPKIQVIVPQTRFCCQNRDSGSNANVHLVPAGTNQD